MRVGAEPGNHPHSVLRWQLFVPAAEVLRLLPRERILRGVAVSLLVFCWRGDRGLVPFFETNAVKTQNPSNGELSHGIVS